MSELIENISEEAAIVKANSWFDQKIFHEVKEEVYQRGTFTVYIIHAVANGKEYEGVGFSKARPDISINQYKPEIGKDVSKGRAVHDLFMEFNKEKEG